MKIALITGATGVIGKAIARQIAEIRHHAVVLVARHPEKAANVVKALQSETGNPNIRFELADLSLGKDILALAERWRGPLHILVNDAGETPRRREETAEGIERQFAINVLGYYRMIRAFIPILADSSPSRVVNVASYWSGGLDLSDLEFLRRSYDNDSAYRQSKQADRMLSAGFAELLGAQGITVNACHPGDVPSTLARNLGFGGGDTPDQAASTPVWLAIDQVGGKVSGMYFEHQREVRCRFSEDRSAVDKLMKACAAYD